MKRPPRNFRPEPFAYHQEIELRIDNLSSLGQGVGRVGGWVVFVPYALPGERVRARVWRNKSSYSDADLVEVLDPSPDRVEPVCPLFGSCGGCQYQHYRYEAQLRWKTQQVREMLLRLAKLDTEVSECRPSPVTYGYRSKITPHSRNPPSRPEEPIGFQKADSRALIDVPFCPIASDAINDRLASLRSSLKAGDPEYRKGVTLLLRDSADGVVTDMRAVVREEIGGLEFCFYAGEFFQNNPHVIEGLAKYTVSCAAASGCRFLVDAYCGVGVFALFGSPKFERVMGVEVSPLAIEFAEKNAESNGITNVEFVLGQAESLFARLDFEPAETAVVLDPPRKGCDQAFIRQLLEWRPARIVYVSCGPDTQARDAVMLRDGGYRAVEVQPFDLFPQTRHIENVITFERTAD